MKYHTVNPHDLSLKTENHKFSLTDCIMEYHSLWEAQLITLIAHHKLSPVGGSHDITSLREGDDGNKNERAAHGASRRQVKEKSD
jgi:hypothetical protein